MHALTVPEISCLMQPVYASEESAQTHGPITARSDMQSRQHPSGRWFQSPPKLNPAAPIGQINSPETGDSRTCVQGTHQQPRPARATESRTGHGTRQEPTDAAFMSVLSPPHSSSATPQAWEGGNWGELMHLLEDEY